MKRETEDGSYLRTLRHASGTAPCPRALLAKFVCENSSFEIKIYGYIRLEDSRHMRKPTFRYVKFFKKTKKIRYTVLATIKTTTS